MDVPYAFTELTERVLGMGLVYYVTVHIPLYNEEEL